MKKVCTILSLLCLGHSFSSNGQLFLDVPEGFKELHLPKIRQVNDSIFEICFLVRLQPGWRLYCQQQKDIRFPRKHMSYFDLRPDDDSVYLLSCSTEEQGIKKESKEKGEQFIGDILTAEYYEDSVLFVRRFLVAKKQQGISRPRISGQLEYMYGKGDGKRKEKAYYFGVSFRPTKYKF